MRLSEAANLLCEAGVEAPLHDARALFRSIGGLSDTELFGRDPSVDDCVIAKAVRRRADREPLAYILGEWPFFHEIYKVDPSVLIPRSDTELLVEKVIDRLPACATFADLCTGSGCIAISVLNHSKDAQAVAVDLSSKALSIAQENARRYSLSERIAFLEMDCLTAFPQGMFDAIVSNPPYIVKEVYDTLSAEVHREPPLAFIAEHQGMSFYRAILKNGISHLKKGGFFAFEIGYDQKEKLEALAKEFHLLCKVHYDLGKNPRVGILTPI